MLIQQVVILITKRDTLLVRGPGARKGCTSQLGDFDEERLLGAAAVGGERAGDRGLGERYSNVSTHRLSSSARSPRTESKPARTWVVLFWRTILPARQFVLMKTTVSSSGTKLRLPRIRDGQTFLYVDLA